MRFTNNAFAQFFSPFVAHKKAVHTRHINIKLIDRRFFEQGRLVADNIGDHVRKLAVGIAIAANNHGLRTQLPRHAHGHSRMHTKSPRFVAARSHHATVGGATYKNRAMHEATV